MAEKSLTDTSQSTQTPFSLDALITADDVAKAQPCGEGGFANVSWLEHPSLGRIAFKRLRGFLNRTVEEQQSMRRRAKREAQTWKDLSHPHILHFKGTFESDTSFYLVSTYADNGPIDNYLKLNPDSNRMRFVVEISAALAYLHAEGIIHGDVKAANVLVSHDCHAQVCDFGLSRAVDTATATTLKGKGSLRWMSPELLFGEDGKTFASDVWAFGMTIYEILTGLLPFHDLPDHKIFFTVLIARKRPPTEPSESSNGQSYSSAWEIAKECWTQSPTLRITMSGAFMNFYFSATPEEKLFVDMFDEGSAFSLSRRSAHDPKQGKAQQNQQPETSIQTPAIQLEVGALLPEKRSGVDFWDLVARSAPQGDDNTTARGLEAFKETHRTPQELPPMSMPDNNRPPEQSEGLRAGPPSAVERPLPSLFFTPPELRPPPEDRIDSGGFLELSGIWDDGQIPDEPDGGPTYTPSKRFGYRHNARPEDLLGAEESSGVGGKVHSRRARPSAKHHTYRTRTERGQQNVLTFGKIGHPLREFARYPYSTPREPDGPAPEMW